MSVNDSVSMGYMYLYNSMSNGCVIEIPRIHDVIKKLLDDSKTIKYISEKITSYPYGFCLMYMNVY